MCLARRASVSWSCTVLQQGVCKTQREEEEYIVKGDFFLDQKIPLFFNSLHVRLWSGRGWKKARTHPGTPLEVKPGNLQQLKPACKVEPSALNWDFLQ